MTSINCNSSKQVFKNPTIFFNALFNPLGNSTCSSAEVVLAFLLYECSTVHNASDQFVSCVYFFFVDFAFHPSTKTKLRSVRADFKQLYLHTYWKLDTYLYELIYSEQSILPPVKIFTVPPETPCMCAYNSQNGHVEAYIPFRCSSIRLSTFGLTYTFYYSVRQSNVFVLRTDHACKS